MNNTLSEDIKELLFENGAVVIPGLGALNGSYKSAAIDGIEGQVLPPSLEIGFDPNAVLNDGILQDFIQRKHSISAQDAESIIKTYTQDVLNAFDRSELVVIPEVGRFYKDFTKNIRFLPDKTNFNTESFGLPNVQFQPISRAQPLAGASNIPVIQQNEKTVTIEAPVVETVTTPVISTVQMPPSIDVVQPPTATPPPLSTITRLRADWQKWIPHISVAALVIVSLILLIFSNNNKKTVSQKTVPKPTIPVNPTPENNGGEATPSVDEPSKAAQNKQEIASDKYLDNTPSQSNSIEENTRPVTIQRKRAIIIIGSFENPNNIMRLQDWIETNGYRVYRRERENLTVIGAEFSYRTDADLNKIYKKFSARYGNGIRMRKL
jgi:hypothetical protein